MKNDMQIQRDVMAELKWDPSLNASEIGVAVSGGVVTLSGIVDSFVKKLKAEEAAKRVAGVKAVAEDIQVGISIGNTKSDTEIAGAVINALKWHTGIKEDKIKVKVDGGVVTLEGEVEWHFQRKDAEQAVINLTGVHAVVNSIVVKPAINKGRIEYLITSAFHRSATIDAGKIKVSVAGNKVTLEGTARSFAEKSDAEKAAWAAPGITILENKIRINPALVEVEH